MMALVLILSLSTGPASVWRAGISSFRSSREARGWSKCPGCGGGGEKAGTAQIQRWFL